MISFDLAFAMIFIAVLSVLAYLGGVHCSCRSGKILLVGGILLAILFGLFLSGKLLWARAVSLSSVVYLGNVMPVIIGFVAGTLSRSDAVLGWRKPILAGALSVIAIGHLLLPIARPLIAPIPVSGAGTWSGDVCLQSHDSTCGAAAAATLLNMKGIPATELQMIRDCLTSGYGTEPLGLYRGLSLATNRSANKVTVASQNPNLWISSNQLPNVALVRFDGRDTPRPLRSFLGSGEGHAIVVLGRSSSGGWSIADPAIGMVNWTDEELQRRFTGEALCLTN